MMHKKKMFAFALMLLLLIQSVCVFSVSATDNTSSYEKIDEELLELMEGTPATDTIPVVVWMNDIDHVEIENDATNTEQYVLKNCSFIIMPHEKIGLIGLNGAGKSTILKLLFRFYDPDDGSIKLDDVDLKEYDIYAVRKVFGVLFQDFVTYCLPLREIIALSDFEERFNDEKLKKACELSGVNEVIKDWENGYDSVLGRFYADNGKDLSGGQWQLVGLARAYFRDCEYKIKYLSSKMVVSSNRAHTLICIIKTANILCLIYKQVYIIQVNINKIIVI